MALSDIVNVQISTSGVQLERAGFGVPLILAADCPGGFTERVRSYTSLAGVLVDFAITTATYKMAAACFAQNPKIPLIKVGRLALKPTQRWAVTPTAADTTVYKMKINGLAATSAASDGSASVSEINVLLKTAIDALALAITVSDQTTFLRIVANTAGATFGVEALVDAGIGVLKLEQDHADPGVATDLGAIALEDNAWYAILNPFNSKAMATEIAAYAESNQKLFLCQSQDTQTVTLALGSDSSTTLAGVLNAATRLRTAIIYHPDNWAFADAALAGAVLPMDPGSETWAYKSLSGPAKVALTSTQRTNAVAKHVNIYTTIAGIGATEKGVVSGNEYIDVIRFRDWLTATLSEDIFAALASMKKIPFTDGGISVIEGLVRARLKIAVDVGGLSPNPAPTVTVPKAADISSADKASRTLNGVKFDAVLAGAIQAINLSGTITV